MLTRLASIDDAAVWLRARVRGTLVADSRRVRAGDGFIAWAGAAADARRFVPQALAAGAAACLVEADGAEDFGFDDERVAAFAGLKAAAGPIADLACDHPSRRLDVIATTGTNGKTSTAWWTAQALSALGRRSAVMGTLGILEPPPALAAAGSAQLPQSPPSLASEPAGVAPAMPDHGGLTTPDAVTLQTALRHFADAGLRACALEASSIGLCEHRLDGVRIAVAMFTNFTRDHLDYHGTMERYWQAKRRLFDWPGLGSAVVCVDDPKGAALAAELQERRPLDLWTVSAQAPARLQAREVRYDGSALAFELHERAAQESARGAEATAAGAVTGAVAVRTGLVGQFNVANLLVVAGALRALGVPLPQVADALARLTPVPGRLQRIADPQGLGPEVVVDYAHTPDALEKVLGALQPLARARGGQLWCVFGCGGDRDATKRAPMGAIAERDADRVVLTSDNPRSESPSAILQQILRGMREPQAVTVLEDRRAAIDHAVTRAATADVVLVAGKGHETTQEIAGHKRPFSDVQECELALARRAAAAPRPEVTA